MKKILLILALILPGFSWAATDTPTNTPTNTPTRTVTPFVVPSYDSAIGEIYISPRSYGDSAGASQLTTVTTSVGLTGTASMWIECAPCAYMANSVSISFTADLRIPADAVDKAGNGKLYAIVSQESANNAGLKATFTQADVPNGLTYTTSTKATRTGIEASIIGAKAAVVPQFVELSSRTITAGAPLRFKPGQKVGLTIQRSSGTTGGLFIHGLVFRYDKQRNIGL